MSATDISYNHICDNVKRKPIHMTQITTDGTHSFHQQGKDELSKKNFGEIYLS